MSRLNVRSGVQVGWFIGGECINTSLFRILSCRVVSLLLLHSLVCLPSYGRATKICPFTVLFVSYYAKRSSASLR